jgi:hypothetical protein
MGFRDLFKKQTKAASPSDPVIPPPKPAPPVDPPSNAGVTKIERDHFLLYAPFQWIAVPGENPLEFEFRNQTLREQLIITVAFLTEPSDQAKSQWIAEELAKKRLSVLATISNGHAVHLPLRFQSGSGQSEVRCFGRDEPQKVRFAFVIRATQVKVITVALTRYFLEEVGSPFESYAGSIFDFLKVKEPANPAGA